jgi:hypothetical protein
MTVSASPRLGKRLRAVLRQARSLPGAAIARAVTRTARARHFSGAFDTRAAAQEAVIRRGGQGYDDAAISEVSFDLMCQRTAWDYPVMFWLQRFLPDADALIDAGGHFGTKYIAFQDLIMFTTCPQSSTPPVAAKVAAACRSKSRFILM